MDVDVVTGGEKLVVAVVTIRDQVTVQRFADSVAHCVVGETLGVGVGSGANLLRQFAVGTVPVRHRAAVRKCIAGHVSVAVVCVRSRTSGIRHLTDRISWSVGVGYHPTAHARVPPLGSHLETRGAKRVA